MKGVWRGWRAPEAFSHNDSWNKHPPFKGEETPRLGIKLEQMDKFWGTPLICCFITMFHLLFLNPLLRIHFSTPNPQGGQGDWWASLTRPASHSGSSAGTLASVLQVSLRLSGSEGYKTVLSGHLLLPHHSLVLTGSSPAPLNKLPNHLLVDGSFSPLPKEAESRVVQRVVLTWKLFSRQL